MSGVARIRALVRGWDCEGKNEPGTALEAGALQLRVNLKGTEEPLLPSEKQE